MLDNILVIAPVSFCFRRLTLIEIELFSLILGI